MRHRVVLLRSLGVPFHRFGKVPRNTLADFVHAGQLELGLRMALLSGNPEIAARFGEILSNA